jgi:DNA polymerase-3 subunit delta'
MLTLSQLNETQSGAVGPLRQARNQGRLHHAYILTGPPSAPRRALADALSQSLMCAQPVDGDACGQCAGCRKFAGGNCPDGVDLRPNDKGVIAIDAIRAVTARLSLRASEGATKIVRVHDADRMPAAAQNALLKTLEEPVGDTLFLLLTARLRALLPTLRSRCQILRLQPAAATASWETLGLPAALEHLMRPALDGDLERAQSWQDLGVQGVWEILQPVLSQAAQAAEIFRAAADLALLEVWLRDALASAAGLTPPAHAAAAATALMQVRQHQAFNVNRAMAIESILLTLAGMRPAKTL